jgi:Domain of unknown function (DUF2017)
VKPVKKRRDRPSGLTLTGLDAFFVQLLRQIPECADPGENKLANARLFSPPTRKMDAKLKHDWEHYVQPELRSHFQTARETVVKDLSRMKPEIASGSDELAANKGAETTFRLQIPSKHYDAWLNALNQARLAIGAKYHLDDSDLNERDRLPFVNERDYRLFQINFYGQLQERILMRLEEINP